MAVVLEPLELAHEPAVPPWTAVLHEWVTTVDHKKIGIMYVLMAVVFFMGMPILIGIGNYLVPLMIGARDMAFPRLNALGFWVSLFGGLLVYFSFATGGAPAVGWFAYAPLTQRPFPP